MQARKLDPPPDRGEVQTDYELDLAAHGKEYADKFKNLSATSLRAHAAKAALALATPAAKPAAAKAKAALAKPAAKPAAAKAKAALAELAAMPAAAKAAPKAHVVPKVKAAVRKAKAKPKMAPQPDDSSSD